MERKSWSREERGPLESRTETFVRLMIYVGQAGAIFAMMYVFIYMLAAAIGGKP